MAPIYHMWIAQRGRSWVRCCSHPRRLPPLSDIGTGPVDIGTGPVPTLGAEAIHPGESA